MENMKKFFSSKRNILIVIGIVVAIVIIIVCCLNGKKNNNGNANSESSVLLNNIKAPVSSIAIKGDTEGVDEFVEALSKTNFEIESPYMNNCYNITPTFVSENSDYKIFKFSDSAESFLMYKGEIFKIGNNKRGDGITSIALADNNGDDVLEIYYSYNWVVSNSPRSNISYFDPITKEEVGIDNTYKDKKIILSTNTEGTELKVCEANITNFETFANMNIIAKQDLDIFVKDNGKVRLVSRGELNALLEEEAK